VFLIYSTDNDFVYIWVKVLLRSVSAFGVQMFESLQLRRLTNHHRRTKIQLKTNGENVSRWFCQPTTAMLSHVAQCELTAQLIEGYSFYLRSTCFTYESAFCQQFYAICAGEIVHFMLSTRTDNDIYLTYYYSSLRVYTATMFQTYLLRGSKWVFTTWIRSPYLYGTRDSSDSGQVPGVGSCEHDNEPLGSIKDGRCLE
jgi:hypothetical protein